MAEGGIWEAQVSIPGSDEIFLLECDPCKFEGTIEEGVGFCTVCQEYLCTDCLRVHRKSKISRTHEILEGNDLSKPKKHSVDASVTDLCALHQQPISKYCKTHDVTACEICLAVDHTKCNNVMITAKICKKHAGPKQTSNFLAEIQSLMDRLKVLEKEQIDKEDFLIQQKKSCLNEMRKLRCAINKLLDKFEEKLLTEIDDIIGKEGHKISSQKSTVQNMRTALKIGADKIEKASKTGEKSTFIAIKNVSVEKAATVLQDVQREQTNIGIKFEPDNLLNHLLNNLKQLGSLIVDRKPSMTVKTHRGSKVLTPYDPENMMTEDLKDRKLMKTGEYSVQEADDRNSLITSSHFLYNDDLLLCDFSNNKMKLMDKTFKLLFSLKLSAEPWDVSLINDKEAVVTLPYTNMIHFLTVTDGKIQLQEGRSIKTDMKCWGVVYHNNQLYVSCHDMPGNSEIIVMDLQGQLLHRVPGSDMFECPSYIAVDSESKIYVSDSDTATLTYMTKTGQIIYTSTSDDTGLSYPRDLLVDNQQNVYVCGQDSHNIQIISADGKLYRSLLKQGEGLYQPHTLTFRSSDKTLVVGQWGNKIVCFRFD